MAFGLSESLAAALSVSRISEDPSAVRAELQHWLESQADKLDKPAGLVGRLYR